MLERSGDSPTKPVGIDVEETEICEKSQLCREVPGNVSVVKVDAGYRADFGVVRRRSAEDSSVLAHIRSNPIPSEVGGI